MEIVIIIAALFVLVNVVATLVAYDVKAKQVSPPVSSTPTAISVQKKTSRKKGTKS